MIWSSFDLEPSVDCSYDYIELREQSPTGRYIGRYCGNNIPAAATYNGPIYMHFHSDSSSNGAGWYVSWTSCKYPITQLTINLYFILQVLKHLLQESQMKMFI